MINTVLLIIILVIVCLLYNIQLNKDKLKKNKKKETQKEIENKYNKLYDQYIPYHMNGSFNSNEDKKLELLRILNIDKKYDLIDELMGGVWYSTLLKEVDNMLKKDI